LARQFLSKKDSVVPPRAVEQKSRLFVYLVDV
jgi:hypothetical protein